jgi:hypothetical protein
MADALMGKWAEVEAASLDLGDQIVAEWVPLLGVTYDAQDDLLDVALSGLNHLIRRPREIYSGNPKGVETVAVVSAEVKQILHLKDPLMLPPAEGRERLSPRRVRGANLGRQKLRPVAGFCYSRRRRP